MRANGKLGARHAVPLILIDLHSLENTHYEFLNVARSIKFRVFCWMWLNTNTPGRRIPGVEEIV
jgi:hypothetical protein